MTKNYFKLDKKDEIMFNQDYIIINQALLFHKSVAVIGNDLLQDKIYNNIGFNYSCEYKTFKDELPNFKALFSEEFTTHPDLFGEYVNTGLCQLKRTKISKILYFYWLLFRYQFLRGLIKLFL